MRPRERLLRKAIPKDAIRKALERWSDRLSAWNTAFTAVVVGGLVIEYLPEITYFLGGFAKVVRPHAEQLREFGGLLVIAGVAGEFCIGLRASSVETDLREESNSTIAELHDRTAKANERVANAEQAAAEANLARVRLERWVARRDISDEERNAIAAKLSRFAGQRIIICTFPVHHEVITFTGLVSATLSQAGWKTELVHSHFATSPDGISCEGFSLSSTPDAGSIEAGRALVIELGPFAGGSVGPLAGLQNPDDPRLQLVVHEREAPPKPSANVV